MKQKWINKVGDKFERVAENPEDEDKTNLNKFLYVMVFSGARVKLE